MQRNLPKPTISVVCPTYNAKDFIEATLNSVLDQLRPPDEFIISDDGSFDETVYIVKKFLKIHPKINVKIIENDHYGPGATRNRGIEASTGEWIAFLDSDDHWLPEKLKVVEEHIINYPSYNFFCHDEIERLLNGKERLLNYGLNYHKEKSLPKQLFNNNLFSTSAVTCKKELLIRAGLFNEQLSSAQDYEMWLRMSPYLRPYFINTVLGFYNQRCGNISSTSWLKRYKNLVKILYYHRDKATNYQFVYIFVLRTASALKNLFIKP